MTDKFKIEMHFTKRFEIILPFWRILWPHIKTITPTSAIDFGGRQRNLELLNKKPIFLIAFLNEKIVGVNSFYDTSKTMCRSRGLWVDPLYRKQGIGTHIIQETEKIGIKQGFEKIWSIPRYEALPFYIKCGFKIASSFFNEYQFGPHCFAVKNLKEKLE
jgi:GNAT superfamily N-acetyltransferase